jgi:predicted nucleic acid-binding protein
MSLYVLDTDTVTLLLHGHPQVSYHAAAHPPSDLSITIITVEEILTGWYSQIRRAKKDDQLARAYAALQEAVEFLRKCASSAIAKRRSITFIGFAGRIGAPEPTI